MNKKVYFAGSIRGGRVDAALYQKIINYIKKTDIVLTEHIGKSNMSLKAQTKEIDVHIYERDTEWLGSVNRTVSRLCFLFFASYLCADFISAHK